MAWISIIVWLIVFLLSSQKEGTSKGKAALLATGAAVGTYVMADPANPNNVLGVGRTPGSAVTADTAGALGGSGDAGSTGSAGSGLNTLLGTAANVITNPNTAKTIAAGGAVSGTGVFSSASMSKWLPWAIGLGAFLLLKK